VMVKVLVSALGIGLAAAVMYYTPSPAPPYKMVDDVVDHLADFDGTTLRVHGYVRAGSIVRLTPNLAVFAVEKQGKQLVVWHDGPLPDTFKDQSEVIATGTLRGEVMTADVVMAKCAVKYEGGPVRTTRFE
jgi:cytochrome c-type biogenesis protein CcmE